MARGHLLLNDVGYVLDRFDDGELLRREHIRPFAPVTVTQGQQRQERIDTYSSTLFGPFTAGFGRDRIPAHRVNEPIETRRFFDATADTRWDSGAYLPLLNVSQTEPTESEKVRASTVFQNVLYTAWDRDDGSNDRGVRTASHSGTTWTGTTAVDTNTAEAIALDLSVFRNHLLLLYASGQNHVIRRSSDGTTWGSAATPIATGLLTNAVTANETIQAGLLTEIGGQAVAVIWHEANGTITFYEGSDEGNTWTDENIEIPSGTGVAGVAVMPGIDGEDKLYVGTGSGVWEVDTAPSTWTFQLVIPMSGEAGNCLRMVVHNGMLWVPVGVGANGTAGMLRMVVQGDRRIVETNHGMDVLDGVPSDMRGNWQWLHSSGKFLYAAYGGGQSGTTGRILCHNGEGWHSVAESAASGSDTEMRWCHVFSEDLHFARGAAGTAIDVAESCADIERNPNSSTGLAREITGYIDLPYSNDGMPTVDGIFLQARVDASNLSGDASEEYVKLFFGANDAIRTTTELGNILSGTLKLNAGSGAGVSARNVGLRVYLNRDSSGNTDTPIVHTVEVDTFKIPDETERFTFRVDLEATADIDEIDVETVIANLEAARDLGTLPTFRYGGDAQRHVKVRAMRFLEEIEGADGAEAQTAPDSQARRIGIVEVVCEEIIG